MSEPDTKVLESPAPRPTPVSLPNDQPGSIRRFFRQLWRLIKIVLILAILLGIGAAIYYGWPIVNDKYLNPIASNSAAAQTAAERLDAGEARLTELETAVAALAASEAGLPDRLAEIEALQADFDAGLVSVTAQLSEHTDRLASLDAMAANLSAGLDYATAETVRQVELLRAMELLSRARLFLFQANYGLAEADVTTARTTLATVQADYPDWEPAVMSEVLFRVDKTIAALPLLPVPASDDLDVAWQVLLTQVVPTLMPDPLDATGTDDSTPTTTTTIGSDG